MLICILIPLLKISNRSNTVRYLGIDTTVKYISGWWSGVLVNDYVSLDGTDNTSFRMDFACIEEAHKIFQPQSHWQGILGLAYQAIIAVSG